MGWFFFEGTSVQNVKFSNLTSNGRFLAYIVFLNNMGCISIKNIPVNYTIKLRLPNFTLSPSQTYVATALRPLRDWQFTPIAEVATRSPIGPGEVAEKSATDRGPRCDQISRSQVFVLAQKTGCDWFGRRQVPAKSPTSPRSVAD